MLPLEIFAVIANYLEITDLINLMLTCKAMYYSLQSEYKYSFNRIIAKEKWKIFTLTLFQEKENPLIMLFKKNRKIYRKLIKEYCLLAVTSEYLFTQLNNKSFLLSVNGKNPNYILNDDYTRDGKFMLRHFYLCT